jgi:hypothetical protein
VPSCGTACISSGKKTSTRWPAWVRSTNAQCTLGSQTAYAVANGLVREANAAGEPNNPKTELALAFEAAMPQEMSVDHALGKIEAQARHEIIFELFPHQSSIGFLVFHVGIQKEKLMAES